MRLFRVGLLFVLCAAFTSSVIAGCSGDDTPADPDTPLPDRHRDDGDASDAAAVDALPAKAIDAASATDGGVDASLPVAPFNQYLVLRLEADAPGGLDANNVWRDLSTARHAITIANDAGAPTVQVTGANGAKVMVFDGTSPTFDVDDSPAFRFGATDDFLVVARTTITVMASGSGGCLFHYLFGKYGSDGATGPHLRVCGAAAVDLVGSLKLTANDVQVPVAASFQTTLDVISFGRNQSGKRIETHAGDSALEATVATPVDVSSVGTPFAIGAARGATGTTFGTWMGKVNRIYVYHAPPGTLSSDDFASIRVFVKNATPLP